MGKRSNSFPRRDHDYYATPYKAVLPLLPFLPAATRFIEPCAGDGRLARHLSQHGHHCVDAFDIEPKSPEVRQADALICAPVAADMVITNFPWSRGLLHPLLTRWRVLMPTWTVLDANWMFTAQAAPFLAYVSDVIAIGRLKWIEGTQHTGKDDVVWLRMQQEPCRTVFHNLR